ncbi:MAG TPA: peptidylprolyl isomerase [Egibacteraceae bacterium]|nr:peptidylprolyl isomerase [Egibacteraceae bacterium]
MSGKQAKRELRRQREEARAAARRKERQRTLVTIAIITALVVLGGAVVTLTLMQEGADERAAAAEMERLQSELEASESERLAGACEPAPPPANAGEDKLTFPDGPEEVLSEGVNYSAVVETSCGRIVFDLYEDRAPESVNSFVFLAQEGFYDGLKIFRNEPSIAIVQTGAGTNENMFQIGYTLPDEFAAAEEEGYTLGSLALAKTPEPDSSGSQIFMVYGDSALPPEYTKFGQATEGLDVLEAIGAAREAVTGEGAEIYLESVTIQTDG